MNQIILSGEPLIVSKSKINEYDKREGRWGAWSKQASLPSETSVDEVLKTAKKLRARYILKTRGNYYIKCYPKAKGTMPTSGELWDEVRKCESISGAPVSSTSKVWILDYR